MKINLKSVLTFTRYVSIIFLCTSVNAQVAPTQLEIDRMLETMRATNDFIGTVKVGPSEKKPVQPKVAPLTQTGNGYDLLIFVSSSMPEAQIKNYSKQARSVGATLVLRGFVNDKQSETRAFVAALNEGGAAWMIHPGAFHIFKVDKVPSIVLSKNENTSLTEDGCAQESTYAKVSGDIQLDAALDLFARRAEPEFATLSKSIISKSQFKYQQKSINPSINDN